MINIQDEHKCCGCKACGQRCPKSCISYHTDEKGFYYPKVDIEKCIDCRLCEEVCPMIQNASSRLPRNQFAGINTNENIRSTSSSGGIFYTIASKIIEDGGAVVGAVFDDKWMVRHQIAESTEDLSKLKGSKYVQSDIREVFLESEKLLKEGRKVLFSGTPCQVAAFKRFLRKSYKNLLCVDIACHGVPSSLIWGDYLCQIMKSTSYWKYVDSLTFKDKSKSWSNYALNIRYHDEEEHEHYLNQSKAENLYMRCFLRNLTLRPSCFQCPSKDGRSGSDIMLGDFWGIDCSHPELNDEKGTSVILCYTKKGEDILNGLKGTITLKEVSFHDATIYNPAITRASTETKEVGKFWEEYISKHTVDEKIKVLNKYAIPKRLSYHQRLLIRLKHFFSICFRK